MKKGNRYDPMVYRDIAEDLNLKMETCHFIKYGLTFQHRYGCFSEDETRLALLFMAHIIEDENEKLRMEKVKAQAEIDKADFEFYSKLIKGE